MKTEKMLDEELKELNKYTIKVDYYGYSEPPDGWSGDEKEWETTEDLCFKHYLRYLSHEKHAGYWFEKLKADEFYAYFCDLCKQHNISMKYLSTIAEQYLCYQFLNNKKFHDHLIDNPQWDCNWDSLTLHYDDSVDTDFLQEYGLMDENENYTW